jgi:hypothetical protein
MSNTRSFLIYCWVIRELVQTARIWPHGMAHSLVKKRVRNIRTAWICTKIPEQTAALLILFL